jgi:predicted metal-dependent hydrolase
MKNKYHIVKQEGEFCLVDPKGYIVAYFQHKHQAEEALADQLRDNDRQQVLQEYNSRVELQALAADWR